METIKFFKDKDKTIQAYPEMLGATATQEGIVTISAQTFGGTKTFDSAPILNTNSIITSTGKNVEIPDATGTLVNLDSNQALTNKTYNGYSLGDACAKTVDTSISTASTSANLPTSAAVATFVEDKGYTTNAGTITGITTSGALTGNGTSGSIAISHSTAAGYKHIPTGGASGQFLSYSASGTASWTSPDTAITSSSTDTTIPSSKAVYELFTSIVNGDNINY